MPQGQVRLIRASDARRVPWKNGRGETHELLLWPEGTSFERGDFDWRVSAARVESDGPFSTFAGFDRTLVITAGPGLILDHGQDAPRARVRALEPYRFSGDWNTGAKLVGGPVSDFNVMTRRGEFRAEVLAAGLGVRTLREQLGARFAVVHSLGGELGLRISGEEDGLMLEAGDSVLLAEFGAADEIEIVGRSPASAVILARLES